MIGRLDEVMHSTDVIVVLFSSSLLGSIHPLYFLLLIFLLLLLLRAPSKIIRVELGPSLLIMNFSSLTRSARLRLLLLRLLQLLHALLIVVR